MMSQTCLNMWKSYDIFKKDYVLKLLMVINCDRLKNVPFLKHGVISGPMSCFKELTKIHQCSYNLIQTLQNKMLELTIKSSQTCPLCTSRRTKLIPVL